jgi:hypothetical protein
MANNFAHAWRGMALALALARQGVAWHWPDKAWHGMFAR